jgi:hypothetical protein
MRKSVGQAPTAGEQTQQKLSDVFRHRNGTGLSYCRTRSDIGSERVKRYRAVIFPTIMDVKFELSHDRVSKVFENGLLRKVFGSK